MCRSRRELSNAYLLAKIGVDTAENEPLEVWGENSIHYSLHSLGCAACTNAVHAICAEMSRKDERVGGCAVLFEEQLVRCAWVGGKDSTDSRSAVADDLCRRLSDAGFSARPAL